MSAGRGGAAGRRPTDRTSAVPSLRADTKQPSSSWCDARPLATARRCTREKSSPRMARHASAVYVMARCPPSANGAPCAQPVANGPPRKPAGLRGRSVPRSAPRGRGSIRAPRLVLVHLLRVDPIHTLAPHLVGQRALPRRRRRGDGRGAWGGSAPRRASAAPARPAQRTPGSSSSSARVAVGGSAGATPTATRPPPATSGTRAACRGTA